MSEFTTDLEQYDGEWAETEVKGGGSVLEDGMYQAKVVVSRVGRSSWDDLQFQLTFEDLGGKGIVTVWDNLDQEIGRSIAKTHTFSLGWEGKLSELPKACEDGFFDDLVCEIRVKDNVKEEKVYKAVYINKLFGKQAVSSSVSPPSADDDLPF